MFGLAYLVSLTNVVRWLAIVGVAAFSLMGVDKFSSNVKRGRVSERALWLAAFLGGVMGIVGGSLVFNHKVSKRAFWPPVLAAFLLWSLFVCALAF